MFLIGRQQNRVDLPLLHESISREHAAIVLDEQRGTLLVDLGSTSGTKLNGQVLQEHIGMPLKDGDEIVFGASTRLYKVKTDYSKFRKALEERQQQLQNEINAIETLSDSNIDDLKKKLGSSSMSTLYVGNLPYHFEETDLKSLFKTCGEIAKIELRKGFAFVQMADLKGAKRVMNYDGHKVMGR